MKLTHYLYMALVALPLASCDFLEESSQDQAYISQWEDLDELLVGDCYLPVGGTAEFHETSNYGQFLHLLADEMTERNTSSTGVALFDAKYQTFGYWTWAHRTGLKETYAGDYFAENTTWTRLYKCINIANNVLKSSEKLPKSNSADLRGYNKVRGEAHFLRAFYYFWLTNAYGQPYAPATANTDLGVPLKTTEEVIDVKFQRNSVADCYAQIEADLLEAIRELSAYGQAQKSIYRADSTAAQLLLSRVYLYMQQYDKAEAYARRVIAAHPALQDLNRNTARFMQKSNPENIFSMGGDDVPCLVSDQTQSYKVNPELLRLYSDDDLRKKNWYYNYSVFYGLSKRAESSTYVNSYKQTDAWYNYYCYSYGLSGSQSPISSLFWLRSSEAYFNLAEALAFQGKDADALAALNEQRAARYLSGAPELSKSVAGEALVNLIRTERRKEFAFEGQRWFDLRRYRVCEKYPSRISLEHVYTYFSERGSATMTEAHKFVLGADDPSWTLPIPTEVLDFNTGMTGNGNVYRDYEVVAPSLQ